MQLSHWLPSCRRTALAAAWLLAVLTCATYFPASATTTPLKPAAAGLRVEASAERAAIWRRVHDQMPEAWKSGRLVIVREISGREMDRLVGAEPGGNPSSGEDDSVVDGYYENDGGTDEPVIISLRDTLRGPAIRLVFAHEYAHYVWDDLMTPSQQREYASLWRQQRRARSLVTEYAAESPDEGFAEAASYYVVNRDLLRRRDRRSLAFIERMVAPRLPAAGAEGLRGDP